MMCPPMLIYAYKRIPSEIRLPVAWSITKTYKLFEEIVGNELTKEHKIREGKIRQNLCSRDRVMH